MQRLATNFNTFIALTIAIFVNLTTCWAFAQLFKFYIVKSSNVYTVYIASNEVHTLSKNNHKESIVKNHINHINVTQKLRTSNTKKIAQVLPQKLSLAQNDNTTLLSQKQYTKPNNQSAQVQLNQLNNASAKNAIESINNKSDVENNYENPIDIKNEPKIAHWIDKHKYYPQKAIFKSEEGKIKLVFLIDKNGYLQNISIIEKSQYDSLNKAAIKIICNSSPIPHQLLTNVSLPMYAKINIIFKLE